jgi:hypothetical protein
MDTRRRMQIWALQRSLFSIHYSRAPCSAIDREGLAGSPMTARENNSSLGAKPISRTGIEFSTFRKHQHLSSEHVRKNTDLYAGVFRGDTAESELRRQRAKSGFVALLGEGGVYRSGRRRSRSHRAPARRDRTPIGESGEF